MIFTEKTIKLKDGALCVFRSPKTEDAGEMLEYLKTCAQETEFILRTLRNAPKPSKKKPSI